MTVRKSTKPKIVPLKLKQNLANDQEKIERLKLLKLGIKRETSLLTLKNYKIDGC